MDQFFYSMDRDRGQKDGVQRSPSSLPSPPDPVLDDVFSRELRHAISRTRQFFFNHQHPDGYWVAELEGDASLESETILLSAFLGEEDSDLAQACARHLLDTQLEDGGWGRYAGSSSDVDNTVKAYFALKITGQDPGADSMQRARVRALELGGADRIDGLTRFYLAILGQIPHSACPIVPPQMMLLPKGFPLNIDSISSWARTVIVPLSIVSALAPIRELPQEQGIREIFVKHPEQWGTPDGSGKSKAGNPFSGNFLFRICHALTKTCRRFGLTPLRRRGIEKARQWTLEHCKRSDGPGAMHSPIVWTWVAMKALGYADESEEIQYCRKQLDDLVIWNEDRNRTRIQPGKSPVWDTSLTLKALMMGGLTATHPAVRKGVQWVRSRHIKEKGDWSHTVDAEPGGWCFEFNNAFYPDCDDTAMALMVLAGRFDEARTSVPKVASRGKWTVREHEENSGKAPESELSGNLPPDLRLVIGEGCESLDEAKLNALDIAKTTEALESGLRWLLTMQNKDGGWGTFDRENHRKTSCRISFLDGGFSPDTLADPSTPDLTGRVMESLARLGFRAGQNVEIDRAVEYMRTVQQPDGSWFGRWGVNYIYGTWLALTGLTSAGISPNDPAIATGANWLLTHQHSSGGWGESPASYEDPSLRGRGMPTASQSAWAVMGLIAAGKADNPAVYRGIRFLLDRQREDGTWYEPEYTGTGIPRILYLKYHYYPVYFPLMALSLYAANRKVGNVGICDEEIILRMQKVRIFSPETDFYNNSRPGEKPEEFIVPELPGRTEDDGKTARKSSPFSLPKFRVFFG